MKKNFKRAGAIVLSTALALSTATTSLPSLSLFNNESVAKAASVTHVTTSPTRVSVHDPSITKSYFLGFNILTKMKGGAK